MGAALTICWMRFWRSFQQTLFTTEDTRGHTRASADQDETPAKTTARREVKVAIIGHPNVGKSTLLNCLTASDRAIVSPIPGTTRDAVDEVVEHNGRAFRFIDTAGIRRKGKTHLMAEKLSVVMARKHLEAADIALLVIDATEGVSQLDAVDRRICPRERALDHHRRQQMGSDDQRPEKRRHAHQSRAHAREQASRRPRGL